MAEIKESSYKYTFTNSEKAMYWMHITHNVPSDMTSVTAPEPTSTPTPGVW